MKLNTANYLHIPFDTADCYEFGSILYRDYFGYELPSFEYQISDIRSMVKAVSNGKSRTFTPVKREEIKYLDGIIFTSKDCGRHIGFYLEGGKFIHQTRENGPVIEKLNSIKWKNKILGYCRYEP